MTDQSEKIIIAEACGYSVVHSFVHSPFAKEDSNVYWLMQNEKMVDAFSWNDFRGKLKPPTLLDCKASLPHYGNDLNAMQKAVLMQDEEFQIRFEEALEERRKGFNPWKMFHQLTASDWRSAFVETLKQLKRV